MAEKTGQPDRSLDRSLITGVAWTGLAKGLGQAARWGSTLIIARILSPDDYGLVTLAAVYIGLIELINEFGLSAAIIQDRTLTRKQVARLGGVSVIVGFILAGISMAAADGVARFFDEPQVKAIVLVMGVTFVIRGTQMLPKAVLVRDLRYREMAIVDGIEAFALAGFTLGFAVAGLGYWALVLGLVVASFISTVVALAYARHPFEWPREVANLRPAMTFGWHVVVSRAAWYVYSNADFFIVGKMLGKTALGAYSMAWNIASIPVERISVLIGRVTPGIFSTVQDRPAELRRYVLGLTEGIALLTFPLSAGLALTAGPFVRVILDEKWTDAIAPMALLAGYAGFRSIVTILPQVLTQTGRARENMRYGILTAVAMPIAFIYGSKWGTVGIGTAWIIVYPFVTVPFVMRLALKITEATWSAYVRSIWPALSSTLIMVAAVLAVRFLPSFDWPEGLDLALSVVVGAASYSGTVWLFHRSRIMGFVDLWRQTKKVGAKGKKG